MGLKTNKLKYISIQAQSKEEKVEHDMNLH